MHCHWHTTLAATATTSTSDIPSVRPAPSASASIESDTKPARKLQVQYLNQARGKRCCTYSDTATTTATPVALNKEARKTFGSDMGTSRAPASVMRDRSVGQ